MIPLDRQILYNSVAGGACSSHIIEQRACSQPFLPHPPPPPPCRSARQPCRRHVTEPPVTGGERPAPAGRLTAPLALVVSGSTTTALLTMLCVVILLVMLATRAGDSAPSARADPGPSEPASDTYSKEADAAIKDTSFTRRSSSFTRRSSKKTDSVKEAALKEFAAARDFAKKELGTN